MKKLLLTLIATLAITGAMVGVAGAEDFSGGVCTGKYKHLNPTYKAQYCAVYGPGGTYDKIYGKGGLYCQLYGWNC